MAVVQSLVGLSLLHRRQVLALQVLDGTEVLEVLVGHLLQLGRNGRVAEQRHGADAAFASDDVIVAGLVQDGRDHDGAEEALTLDAIGQLLELALIEELALLVRVGPQLVDVDVKLLAIIRIDGC